MSSTTPGDAMPWGWKSAARESSGTPACCWLVCATLAPGLVKQACQDSSATAIFSNLVFTITPKLVILQNERETETPTNGYVRYPAVRGQYFIRQ